MYRNGDLYLYYKIVFILILIRANYKRQCRRSLQYRCKSCIICYYVFLIITVIELSNIIILYLNKHIIIHYNIIILFSICPGKSWVSSSTSQHTTTAHTTISHATTSHTTTAQQTWTSHNGSNNSINNGAKNVKFRVYNNLIKYYIIINWKYITTSPLVTWATP